MAMTAQGWFLYLARCSDGTIYTGIARVVAARMAAHDAGRGARYTRGRGPLALCAIRRCGSQSEALRWSLDAPARLRRALPSSRRKIDTAAAGMHPPPRGTYRPS